jgi:hypothetical protein
MSEKPKKQNPQPDNPSTSQPDPSQKKPPSVPKPSPDSFMNMRSDGLTVEELELKKRYEADT